MSRWFNIGGPCIAADHYMLPAAERLPEVMMLIRKKQYFVVHAQRQCGKTTAFRALMDEINAKGEYVAMYCSVEAVEPFTDPEKGAVEIVGQIRFSIGLYPELFGEAADADMLVALQGVEPTARIAKALSWLSERVKKPLVVFFDEVDCLSEGTLISFLRQLRNGRISCTRPNSFPVSVALIGMRNIRDYKMRVRPDGESKGEASPFNVITKAMTLSLFTEPEVRALYAQHTAETGQVFEEEALRKAFDYSRGQPYLVNALARWCVEKIHREDFSQPVTGADMDEAKEKIIRERGTHLDSIMEKALESRVRKVVEPMMLGGEIDRAALSENISYCLELGLLVDEDSVLRPANPIYAETLGRYLSYTLQQDVRMKVPENPWVRDDGLDMPGLMAAFQQFWRENADANTVPYQYTEAYPQLVLQAFLQRVVNGGGVIRREMALGKGALDLGVEFRGAVYPVEVKKRSYYDKSHAKAHEQVARYMDRLGKSEGWLVVADPDLSKPWDGKITSFDVALDGRTIHVITC